MESLGAVVRAAAQTMVDRMAEEHRRAAVTPREMEPMADEAKVSIPKGREVAKSKRVDAPGVGARLIGVQGTVWANTDTPCRVLEVADDTVVIGLEDGRQAKVGPGEGYFIDVTGPLPAGALTGEPTPGAVGESDADRQPFGTGPDPSDSTIVEAPRGEPGAVAGVLPAVRPPGSSEG